MRTRRALLLLLCAVATPFVACGSPPTVSPTLAPSLSPTLAPTESPIRAPTSSPTRLPTRLPTRSPTAAPTPAPTPRPTAFDPRTSTDDGPWLQLGTLYAWSEPLPDSDGPEVAASPSGAATNESAQATAAAAAPVGTLHAQVTCRTSLVRLFAILSLEGASNEVKFELLDAPPEAVETAAALLSNVAVARRDARSAAEVWAADYAYNPEDFTRAAYSPVDLELAYEWFNLWSSDDADAFERAEGVTLYHFVRSPLNFNDQFPVSLYLHAALASNTSSVTSESPSLSRWRVLTSNLVDADFTLGAGLLGVRASDVGTLAWPCERVELSASLLNRAADVTSNLVLFEVTGTGAASGATFAALLSCTRGALGAPPLATADDNATACALTSTAPLVVSTPAIGAFFTLTRLSLFGATNGGVAVDYVMLRVVLKLAPGHEGSSYEKLFIVNGVTRKRELDGAQTLVGIVRSDAWWLSDGVAPAAGATLVAAETAAAAAPSLPGSLRVGPLSSLSVQPITSTSTIWARGVRVEGSVAVSSDLELAEDEHESASAIVQLTLQDDPLFSPLVYAGAGLCCVLVVVCVGCSVRASRRASTVAAEGGKDDHGGEGEAEYSYEYESLEESGGEKGGGDGGGASGDDGSVDTLDGPENDPLRRAEASNLAESTVAPQRSQYGHVPPPATAAASSAARDAPYEELQMRAASESSYALTSGGTGVYADATAAAGGGDKSSPYAELYR